MSDTLSVAIYGAPGMLGGASWTPAALSNLELWLRPEELGAPLTLITTWADQSSNGNDATQSTTSHKPLVQGSVLDGYSGALFDGVDDLHTLNSEIVVSGAFEAWCVFDPGAIAAYQTVFGGSTSSSDYIRLSNSAPAFAIYRSVSGGVTNISTNTFAASTPVLVRVLRNASNEFTVEKNGVDVTIGGTPTNAGDFRFGRIGSRSGSSDPFGGHFIERFVVSGNMDAADEASALAYFSGRYATLGI